MEGEDEGLGDKDFFFPACDKGVRGRWQQATRAKLFFHTYQP